MTGPPPPRRPRVVFHPILVAAFPVLSLYAHNVYETPADALVAPLALAVAGALAAWLALALLTRDATRAGLVASLLAASCFGFARWSTALDEAASAASQVWVPHMYHIATGWAVAAMGLVLAPAIWAICRKIGDPGRWTTALNAFGLIAVMLPVGSIALARLREPSHPTELRRTIAPSAAAGSKRPDIYYIILDGYARSDVMKAVFDYDNTPFLRGLEVRGFFVAKRSTSNYPQTRLSLASSLNFDYLDRLLDPASRDPNPVAQLVSDNAVVRTLRPLGYRFIAFATGYEPTECPNADAYLTPRFPTRAFHRMVAGMTPLGPVLYPGENRDQYFHYRERILFDLERLPTLAREPGPKFTFAHIICPHPPFCFAEDGGDASPHGRADLYHEGHTAGGPVAYRSGYRAQAIFISRRITAVVDRILADSPEPPIIIIQSDHGSGLFREVDPTGPTDLHERFSNLVSVYFPDRDYAGLDDRISPVNLFRVVLNRYFAAGLPILPRRNLDSTADDPLEFTDVTAGVAADVPATPRR